MADLNTICVLLEAEPHRNLVTLKMINSYSNSMTFDLVRDGTHWALLSLLPTGASDWDRNAYPNVPQIAFIDGTASELMEQLFARLPTSSMIVKTASDYVRSYVLRLPSTRIVDSYHSYTTHNPYGQYSRASVVERSANLREKAAAAFKMNGYEISELDRYFNNGAQWFGITEGGKLASVCFVFQNYKEIWEIGGVYTAPEYRMKGLAKSVVSAAIEYLQEKGTTIRYQARWNNGGSIRLAESCGLEEFLKVDHILLPERVEKVI